MPGFRSSERIRYWGESGLSAKLKTKPTEAGVSTLFFPKFGLDNGEHFSDPDEYEHGENPQYNLIFTPWDAQFDEQEREWGSFSPAEEWVQGKFDKALERVNNLGPVMQSRFEQSTQAWFALCQKNLEKWCGEGLRLKLTN